MDTRELLTFVTMCQTLNYQRAADRLQYAPSTLFKHVRHLEGELGEALFLRDRHGMRLSEAGMRFLPYAERMLAEYRAAMGQVEQSAELSIGGCELNISNALLPMLTAFAKAHPKIGVRYVTMPNADVPQMVREGKVDVGFYYSARPEGLDGVQCLRLFREQAVLMARPDSPLAGKKRLSYEDLSEYAFVFPHDTCCLAKGFTRELERRGVRLREHLYLGSELLVLSTLAERPSFTLAPQSAARRLEQSEGLCRLPLDEPPVLAWETLLLGVRAASPAARALADFSVQHAQAAPGAPREPVG